MSALFLPRRWRRQPVGPVRIDRTHPIGAKVHHAYTPWSGRSAIVAGKRSDTPVLSTAVANLGLVHDARGAAPLVRRTGSFSGEGLYMTGNPSNLGTPQPSSIFVLVDRLRYGNSDSVGLLRIYTGDRLQISAASAGRKLQLSLYSGVRATGNGSIPEGYTGSIALTAFSLQSYSLHVGGRLDSSGSTNGYNIRDFRGLGSTSIAWPTWSCPLFVYADALSDNELVALDENPWQIFQPRLGQRLYWMPASTGERTIGATQLVAAFAQSASIEPVALPAEASAQQAIEPFAASASAQAWATLAASHQIAPIEQSATAERPALADAQALQQVGAFAASMQASALATLTGAQPVAGFDHASGGEAWVEASGAQAMGEFAQLAEAGGNPGLFAAQPVEAFTQAVTVELHGELAASQPIAPFVQLAQLELEAVRAVHASQAVGSFAQAAHAQPQADAGAQQAVPPFGHEAHADSPIELAASALVGEFTAAPRAEAWAAAAAQHVLDSFTQQARLAAPVYVPAGAVVAFYIPADPLDLPLSAEPVVLAVPADPLDRQVPAEPLVIPVR